MPKKYKYSVSQSRSTEMVDLFPNSDIPTVTVITSNFANCAIKAILHENKIYVQQLACDKPSILPIFYDNHKDVLNPKYAVVTDSSELEADYLRERNFSVLIYGRHYDYVEEVFHAEVILVGENVGHGLNALYWSLNMFKHTNDDMQVFCENNPFIKAICLALQYYRTNYGLTLGFSNN